MIEDSVNPIVPAAPEDSETNERVTCDEFCVMRYEWRVNVHNPELLTQNA